MIAATKQRKPTRRILIVDDEPLIRTLVARVLLAAGYEVLEAGDAEEALGRFNEQPFAFSMVVSDVGLPQASGFELMTQITEVRPALPILLMSASPRRELISARTIGPDTFVLQKPFGVGDLLDRVNAAHSVNGSSPRARANQED